MAEGWCLFLALFAYLALSLPVYCNESDLDKVSSITDTIGQQQVESGTADRNADSLDNSTRKTEVALQVNITAENNMEADVKGASKDTEFQPQKDKFNDVLKSVQFDFDKKYSVADKHDYDGYDVDDYAHPDYDDYDDDDKTDDRNDNNNPTEQANVDKLIYDTSPSQDENDEIGKSEEDEITENQGFPSVLSEVDLKGLTKVAGNASEEERENMRKNLAGAFDRITKPASSVAEYLHLDDAKVESSSASNAENHAAVVKPDTESTDEYGEKTDDVKLKGKDDSGEYEKDNDYKEHYDEHRLNTHLTDMYISTIPTPTDSSTTYPWVNDPWADDDEMEKDQAKEQDSSKDEEPWVDDDEMEKDQAKEQDSSKDEEWADDDEMEKDQAKEQDSSKDEEPWVDENLKQVEQEQDISENKDPWSDYEKLKQVDEVKGWDGVDYDDNEDDEYEAEDDWYYDPHNKKPAAWKTFDSSTPTLDSVPDEDLDDEKSVSADKHTVGRTQIDSPSFNEGVVSIEDVQAKKSLPAPKTTIILYTVLIIVLIAAVVIISVWKGPFRFKKRQGAMTIRVPQIIVPSGEEEKRLLSHPFV